MMKFLTWVVGSVLALLIAFLLIWVAIPFIIIGIAATWLAWFLKGAHDVRR